MRVCGWAQTHVSAWCGHGMGEGRGVGQATRWVRGKRGGGARGLCWAGDNPPPRRCSVPSSFKLLWFAVLSPHHIECLHLWAL